MRHQSAAYLLSGAAGSGYAPPAWNTVATYHRLSYDALGALTLDETLAQSSVLWSTSTLYDGWQQQHYDANGRRKDRTVDAFGNLTQVTEYNTGGATYTTTYGYDVAGNLTLVTDALGNTTSLSYDLLGRKTAMNDPDMGYWTYAYDGSGNLARQTDQKNQRLCFYYDAANRPTSKRSDGTGAAAWDQTTDTDAVVAEGAELRRRNAALYLLSSRICHPATAALDEARRLATTTACGQPKPGLRGRFVGIVGYHARKNGVAQTLADLDRTGLAIALGLDCHVCGAGNYGAFSRGVLLDPHRCVLAGGLWLAVVAV